MRQCRGSLSLGGEDWYEGVRVHVGRFGGSSCCPGPLVSCSNRGLFESLLGLRIQPPVERVGVGWSG
eukprot:scaffold162949_cov33-Tisochrysis_lutea.AAC.1